MSEREPGTSDKASPRVVVVGPCASGKTTLVRRLNELGVDARVSGQEHSAVKDLWRRLDPDLLIVLDVDLQTLRDRRSPSWPETIYNVQLERLTGAIAAADAVIDSTAMTEDEVVGEVMRMLERR